MRVKSERQEKIKRHKDLSWKIIEHKIRYYTLDQVVLEDYEYDSLEMEYLQLCVELSLPNTVVHKTYAHITGYSGDGMMEVDYKRPSVNLVLDVLRGLKFLPPKALYAQGLEFQVW